MDKKIKQRCVGALVLILIAAVMVPFFFHSNSIKPEQTTLTQLVPVAPKSNNIDNTVQKMQDNVNRQRHKIAKAVGYAQKQRTLISYVQPLIGQQPVASLAEHNWYLQVASFHDFFNAEKLQGNLLKNHIVSRVMTQKARVHGHDEKLFSVILGPYKNQQIATCSKQKIFKLTKLEGLIIYK